MLEQDLFENAYGAFEAFMDERQRCEAIVERALARVEQVNRLFKQDMGLSQDELEEVLHEIRTGTPL